MLCLVVYLFYLDNSHLGNNLMEYSAIVLKRPRVNAQPILMH